MAGVFNMDRTPVQEIILSVSFAENLGMDCLNKFRKLPEVQNTFPHVTEGFHANLSSKVVGSNPIADFQKTGYILKCPDPCNRIIHAKRGMFSYHKTKSYEKFNTLLSELDYNWKLFSSCTKELSVTSVSIRYINLIELNEDEEHGDFLTFGIESPFEFSSYFNQIRFIDPEDDSIWVTVVSSNGMSSTTNGLVLDLLLKREYNDKPFDSIAEAFVGMRDRKNSIFRTLVKDKTIEKYTDVK